ncbi:MAG TPA: hypothetical protein VEX68_14710 [Bryobacteraceae bacterium]|nr:hypothetical protein [Bryobacteraceae bacterium]
MQRATDFQWSVNADGYEIRVHEVGDPPVPQKYLVPRKVAGTHKNVKGGYRQTVINPLRDDPALFRSFADLSLHSEDIRRFADEHGWLGVPESRLERRGTVGEGIVHWREWMREMRHLLRIWDAIKQENNLELRKWFDWKTEYQVVYAPSGVAGNDYKRPISQRLLQVALDGPIVADRNASATHFRYLKRFDLIDPAKLFIQEELNHWIQHLQLEVRLLWNEELSKLQAAFVPVHLIGALWVQFLTAVTEDLSFRKCNQCRRWFSEAARAAKVFCSDACRMKAYRLRKASGDSEPIVLEQEDDITDPITTERVKELNLDGVTVEEIALYYDVLAPDVARLAGIESFGCELYTDNSETNEIVDTG